MGKELHNKELIEDNFRLNQELLKAELRIAELEKIANLHVLPNENEEDYYVLLDSETRFIHISKIDYGYKMSDFLGKKFSELFSKDLTDLFIENFEQAKLTGKSNIYFATFQSPNGKVTQRNQIREIVINEEKYYQIRAENVTNSYERLKEAQEKENLTNLALESTQTGTWSFSTLSMVFVLSKTVRSIFEYNNEILDIPTFMSFIHADDINRVSNFVKESLAGTNNSSDITYKILLPSGKLKHLNTTFKGIADENEELVNFYGITQDITEKVFKSQTEIQYNSLIQSINTNLRAGLYRSTPEDGLIFCNKAMWEMFGYSSFEEIKSTPVTNLYKDVETRDVSFTELTKRYNNGEIYSSKEFEYKRKDGSTFYALVNSVLQKDSNGNFYFDGAVHDITEMKVIEENLKKQELMFSSLLQNSLDVFSIYDKEGKGIFHSNRLYELLGYTKEEILSTGFWNYIHKDDVDSLLVKFNQLVQTNDATIEFLVRIISKSGDIIYFEGIAKNMIENEGIGGIVVNGREVTDRILRDNELKEQQNRFRTILDTTESTYVLIDRKGIVISFNKRMYEETLAFFNVQIQNNVTHYKEFVIPGKMAEFESNYSRALSGENINIVRNILAADGTELWYSFHFKPAYDANEGIYAVSMSTLNVTSLKENESKLEKSLLEIKALFNAIPDTILELDSDGIILDFKAGSKFEKHNSETVIGNKIDVLNLNSHIVSDLLKSISAAINNKLVELVEFSKEDEYGDSNYFEARIVSNTDSSVIAIVRDITDRKRFEYRMRALNSELEMKIQERTSKLGEAIVDLSTEIDRRIAAQKEAETARELLQHTLDKEIELNEMKTKFVAMVSHEYRTPLTIIQTSAFLLEKYFLNKNEQRFLSNLDKVHKAVASMVDMLENVLSYSNLESGKIQRRLTQIGVQSLCEGILQQFNYISVKGIHKIILKIENEDSTIISDQNLLNQIISNLLFNAIKYSPNGGNIELIVTESTQNIAFSVKDYGIGIAPEDINRLTKPFQRGGNVQDIAGTGLGLSIVQAWTEILEGEIKIDSKLGKGTIFTVILPRNYKK